MSTFVSITRLRLRSIRFFPAFAIHAVRSFRQTQKAPGFIGGEVLPDRRWTFWTMTAWNNEASMRRFMSTGAHRAAMPGLLEWCDEASVVHWTHDADGLPTWQDANARMRLEGRPSKVRRPSLQHAALAYREPRRWRGARIDPERISIPPRPAGT